MKINLKVRLKNPVFLIAAATLIISFVYTLLGLFGIVPSVSEDAWVSIVKMLVDILTFLGICVDPTTKGVSDSTRALNYTQLGGGSEAANEYYTNEDFSAEEPDIQG